MEEESCSDAAATACTACWDPPPGATSVACLSVWAAFPVMDLAVASISVEADGSITTVLPISRSKSPTRPSS